MSADVTERFVFEVEWFDTVADMIKKFYLYYFPADKTIELFDIKNRKIFLRRTKCESIEAKNLFVGAVITIFSRAMKIVDIPDTITREKLKITMQKTFAMLKPNVVEKLGNILKIVTDRQLHIANIKMCLLNEEDAEKILNHETYHQKKYLTSGPVVMMILLGDNAINCWNDLITSNKTVNSLTSDFHGSASEENAEKELEYFFPGPKSPKRKFTNTATLKNCTCAIIKPHAVQAKLTGDIICDIKNTGFNINAIQQFCVDPVNAAEFLEVYKAVLPDYGAMVAELQSGPCIAMEITHKDRSIAVPEEFRKFCGPMDPEIARQVRPNTLRAKYGKTKIQNAIHCSDLPEDGILEVEYFFKILDD